MVVAHIDNPNIQGQESYVLSCRYIKHHVKVASFLKQMEESISNLFLMYLGIGITVFVHIFLKSGTTQVFQ